MSLADRELGPRLWRVDSAGGDGNCTSLTDALLKCRDGDTVTVAEGVYSPETTGEVFPLYVPTGVLLQGQGDSTVIDGQSWGRLSNRPLNSYESLVLLGDGSSLQNMSITNSGGNAVSHLQGASFHISACKISDNGQHGVLLYGPGRAVITNNRFHNNGTRKYEPPPTPIPAPAKQGHHIYLEGMASTQNQVTISANEMIKTFADGFALAPVFDDPSDVSIDVSIDGNTIDTCGRNGLTLSASYGTSNAVARVSVTNNVIRNCGSTAISATAIFPLVQRALSNVLLKMVISHNVLEAAEYGVNAVGGFSPASNGICDLVLSHNQISQCSKNGLFMATAIGDYHLPTSNNKLTARVFGNTVSDCKQEEMAFFAYQKTNNELGTDNVMLLSLDGNSSPPGQILLHAEENDTNVVRLQGGSQGVTQKPLVSQPHE